MEQSRNTDEWIFLSLHGCSGQYIPSPQWDVGGLHNRTIMNQTFGSGLWMDIQYVPIIPDESIGLL